MIRSQAATKAVASLTLGVYLIHPIFLETLVKFGWGPRDFPPLIAIPSVAITVALAAVAVAWSFSRTPGLKRTIRLNAHREWRGRRASRPSPALF